MLETATTPSSGEVVSLALLGFVLRLLASAFWQFGWEGRIETTTARRLSRVGEVLQTTLEDYELCPDRAELER